MKNILFIVGSMGAGGLEKVTSIVANHYAKKGNNVFILQLLSPEVFQILDSNIKIIKFTDTKIKSSQVRYFFRWIKCIKKCIEELSIDTIIAMTFKIGALTVLANKKRKAKLIVREVNDPIYTGGNKILFKIIDKIVSKADAIIFQTEWEKKCHSKKCAQIGHIIYNPIIVCEEACSQKTKKIVSMGRLDIKQKKQDVLIRAFSLFLEKHPQFVLEIYGKGPDKEIINKLIQELNIEEKVYIFDPCVDIHKKIKNASIFVLSSEFEGLSNALVEAMLIGIPCISSNWNGVEEVIIDGFDGLIFRKDNVMELTNLMEKVVSNAELSEKLSKNAKEKKYIFSYDNVISKWEKLIGG